MNKQIVRDIWNLKRTFKGKGAEGQHVALAGTQRELQEVDRAGDMAKL